MDIKTTFDIEGTVESFEGLLLKDLCKQNEIMCEVLDYNEIKSQNKGVVLHNPIDYQIQLFVKGEVSYPHLDEEDFLLDKFLASNQQERSFAEKDVNNALYKIGENSINVSPIGKNYCYDITDKLNASKILEELEIPTPNKYEKQEVTNKRLFAKHRKGSKCNNLYLLSSCQLQNKLAELTDYLVQEEVNTPTSIQSYVRVTVDFGEITSAAIMYSDSEIPQSDEVGRILLNCQGFEHKQNLSKKEKEILSQYGGKREIPQKLVDYSRKIFNFTKNHGLHSIGIDYLFDTEKNKWVCSCDINRAPGRRIYNELERVKGNDPGERMFDRVFSTAKYLKQPFRDYIKAHKEFNHSNNKRF